MASSEISSSEVNQGQGFYHDGKNEASGLPALPSPVAPDQVPLEMEESMWKKYSSHYEFPLSLVIAVGIHVIAILFVVAFMTLNFYWGQPKPPAMEPVTIEPPRIHQEGVDEQSRPGGSNGQQGEDGRDPQSFQYEPFKLTLPDPGKVTVPSDLPGDLATLPDNRPLQPNRLGTPGKPDGGIGNKSGPGVGNTAGSGAKMGRNKRWRIHFNYDEPEVLLAQFANLQVTVAGRLNNGRFIVFKKLSTTAPYQYEEMTETVFSAYVNGEQRLWFMNTDRVTCDNFAYAVSFSDRMLMLVLVIPAEMEKAILAAELRYHHLTEDEIRARRLSTSFRVVREGSNWNVTVTNSEVVK